MAVRDRVPCAHCGNERRKPIPLGVVMGLSGETADLLVCHECHKFIHDHFSVSRAIRVRLQVAAEEAAFLAGTSAE